MGKPFTTNELRESYLRFFEQRGCTRVASAPLVPANDPTILFTVAGMAQFKDMFLGRGNLPYTRATTCQKCIRTNDILQVGRTPRHHTFFEMLGNFSFDDYFKRETIAWAWEFLTQVVGLEPDRLSVSVHHIDDEAHDIWHKEIGLPADRIFRMGDGDNFWPADAPTEGPTGPGGCCSEIFWDFQTNDDPDDDLTKDSGRFVEVWNLVFPQFNVSEPIVDGRYTLEELGRQNIDTGMGLERLACVVQGKHNNFDIDLLQHIVQQVATVTGRAYRPGAAAGSEAEEHNALIRRIADHVRAVTFCIADGALPGNTGRGYVVRRLIRRATLDIDRLGVERAALHEVVGSVVAAMGDAYPEIGRRRELAEQTLQVEEDNFRGTLRKGLDLIGRALERHRSAGETVFSGDDAFELFTTHGFPKELIEELVQAEGMRIDEERYDERWQAFTRISGGKQVDVFTRSDLLEAKPRLGATAFSGYDRFQEDTAITLLEVDGSAVEEAPVGSTVRLALERTPFYGEGGGQIGDTGHIEGDGFRIRVTDTQKDEDLFIHIGEVESGTARTGPARAVVDEDRRAAITRHHSATHLLHAALYEIVGDHVEQQGSEVRHDQLRFDYNNPGAPEAQQLQAVEDWVNARIDEAHAVQTEEIPIATARQRGAKAQFGEKYGETVRVVSMGGTDAPSGAPCSIELCGGCHVQNTAEIGAFRIVREEASAAGIRRLVAVAGTVAERLAAEEQRLADACARELGLERGDTAALSALRAQFKAGGDELVARIAGVAQQLRAAYTELDEEPPGLAGSDLRARVASAQEAIKQAQRRLEQQRAQAAMGALDALLDQRQEVEGMPLIAGQLPGADAKSLREAAATVGQRHATHIAVLGAAHKGKALLVVSVSGDLVAQGLKAGSIVGRLAKLVGGGGGGKPDLAQAGGRDPDALPDAIAAAAEVVANEWGRVRA
ncbi:MAG: alanine--tRNA ligase [Planctomycetota bacterium]